MSGSSSRAPSTAAPDGPENIGDDESLLKPWVFESRRDFVPRLLDELQAQNTQLRTQATELDITRLELAAALAAITSREKRARAILDGTHEGIITFDADGEIESFNAAAEMMFGYREEELLGQHFSLLMPEPDAERYVEHMEADLTRPCLMSDLLGRRADGSDFPIEVSLARTSFGERKLFIQIIRDLSEVHALQQRLARARHLEALGGLAAGIAHEINTPAQVISDNLQFLQESAAPMLQLIETCQRHFSNGKQSDDGSRPFSPSPGELDMEELEFLRVEVPRAFSQTMEGLGQISKIVSSMRDFANPPNRGRCPVDLNRAIENAATISRNRWKYVAVMELQLGRELPMIHGVNAELNQVFLNLIVNAAQTIQERQASEECLDPTADGNPPGVITIRSRLDFGRVRVEIEDTGLGIAPELEDRVFDPFFTTREVGSGTGQGLAVAHTVVVKGHGGDIQFESRPGLGTTFVLHFPVPEENTPDSDPG